MFHSTLIFKRQISIRCCFHRNINKQRFESIARWLRWWLLLEYTRVTRSRYILYLYYIYYLIFYHTSSSMPSSHRIFILMVPYRMHLYLISWAHWIGNDKILIITFVNCVHCHVYLYMLCMCCDFYAFPPFFSSANEICLLNSILLFQAIQWKINDFLNKTYSPIYTYRYT